MKCFDVTRRAKAKMLGIKYEKYKQLEKDSFGENEERKINAEIEKTMLMNEASKRIRKKKGKENV